MDITNLCLSCMEEKGAAKTCPFCGYEEGAAPESLLHLPPGFVLQDKYLLGRVLGQGGFGVTYLAWDKTLNIKLAIKEYLPQQLVTRTAGSYTVTVYKPALTEDFNYGLTRFLEEARTLARFIEHPNVVSVRDYFEDNGTAYLVMSYYEGLTLQSYLDYRGGSIPIEQALSIFMPVLDALKEVHHAGILHRDISPDNLLIDKDGRVILIDFGAARQAMGEKSRSLSVIMKAGYSPEEQYRSRGKQGPWTDIYAVAATMYRAITGQVPLEAIDRLDEDDLTPPSQLGITIEQRQEQVLLKALAVKAKDRYQSVDQFQSELITLSSKGQAVEGYAGVRPKKPVEVVEAAAKSSEKEIKEKAQADAGVEAAGVVVDKLKPAQEPASWDPQTTPAYTVSKKAVITAAAAILCGLLVFGAVSLFGGRDDTAGLSGPGAEEPPQTYDPAVIVGLDADYYIDYENGTIPLDDLPIGSKVVDPSWEWEFRTGHNYSGSGEVKPVTWIVVAKDHYSIDSGVTLLSKDLVGLYTFDDSTNRGSDLGLGNNHWGNSGTNDATRGLRPWLNSSGIHFGEGFYQVFSENFKSGIITSRLPNMARLEGGNIGREMEGIQYETEDMVFIPSSTELGDLEHFNTYQIGTVFPYFEGAVMADQLAKPGGGYYNEATGSIGNYYPYWTRSPCSEIPFEARVVSASSGFEYGNSVFGQANKEFTAVRPVVNMKSGILVSKIPLTVNINTASFEELQEIIHIGPEEAQQIISKRLILSLDELLSISELSEKNIQDIKDQSIAYIDPETIGVLNNCDYIIDNESGTIPISELEIGSRVVDPSWMWEFRTVNNYTGHGSIKPVTWIVAAKNHYGVNSGITMLTEELIGFYTFDDSTNRVSHLGSNHWGNSGTANASNGLRPWLNSTGIHVGEGFYQAFSESFKSAIIKTTLPNREWKNGRAYNTEDMVFIPSTTEIGDTDYQRGYMRDSRTYEIGKVYPYFQKADKSDRIAQIANHDSSYWTRSPSSGESYLVICIISSDDGEFWGATAYDQGANFGVRPALNLKSDTLVSEIRK